MIQHWLQVAQLNVQSFYIIFQIVFQLNFNFHFLMLDVFIFFQIILIFNKIFY